MPNAIQDFHLPTDLLGIIPGKYDDTRADGNIEAALGPFCNQVRLKAKDYVYQSMMELEHETREIKKIAIERKGFWEAFLTAAILRNRMAVVKRNFDEVQKGYVFKKSVSYSVKEFISWFRLASSDITRIIKIAQHLWEIELHNSWGKPGEPGDVYEIKSVVDKIVQLCNHLIVWETDLQTIIAPDELQEIPNLMQGWTNLIINEFVKLPALLEEGFSEKNINEKEANNELILIEIVFEPPPNIDAIMGIVNTITDKIISGELDYD